MDATAEIAFEVGVFAWIVGDVGDERFREIVGIDIEAEFFDDVQPEDLQFQIVVREADFPEFWIEFVGEKLFAAFERGSDGAADAFSKPAAIDAVTVFGEFHVESFDWVETIKTAW